MDGWFRLISLPRHQQHQYQNQQHQRLQYRSSIGGYGHRPKPGRLSQDLMGMKITLKKGFLVGMVYTVDIMIRFQKMC